jgi:hypothetical protein
MNVSMHDVPPRSRARSFVLGSQRKEIKMKKSAEDRTEGAARQVSGKIKQAHCKPKALWKRMSERFNALRAAPMHAEVASRSAAARSTFEMLSRLPVAGDVRRL